MDAAASRGECTSGTVARGITVNAAMAAAVRAGSQTPAEQILIDTGTEGAGPGHAPHAVLRHGRHEPGR